MINNTWPHQLLRSCHLSRDETAWSIDLMHCSGLAWYTINGTEAKLLLGSRNLSISVRKVELV